MTPETTRKESKPRKGRSKYAELGRMLRSAEFREELYNILDAYQRQPREETFANLGELASRLNLLAKGFSQTVLDVISDHPQAFAKDLKRVYDEQDKQQLKLLNAKYCAYYIGIVGSYAEEWRGWRIEPFYDPDIETVVFRISGDLRNGKKTVWMDDAEAILHIMDDIISHIIKERELMEKDQLRDVEKRLNDIRRTLTKATNK